MRRRRSGWLLDELSHWTQLQPDRHQCSRQHDRAHLLDSLAAQPDLRGRLIADVGTGAGFPRPAAGRRRAAAAVHSDRFGGQENPLRDARRAHARAHQCHRGAFACRDAGSRSIRHGARLCDAGRSARQRAKPVWTRDARGRVQRALSARRTGRVAARLAARAGTQGEIPGLAAERHILNFAPQPGVSLPSDFDPSSEAGSLKALVETSSAAV